MAGGTHYETLGVGRAAEPEVIVAAYRALARRHHPDFNPGDAAAAERMAALNEAYAVLGSPARRQAHDRWLAERERPSVRAAPRAVARRRRRVRSWAIAAALLAMSAAAALLVLHDDTAPGAAAAAPTGRSRLTLDNRGNPAAVDVVLLDADGRERRRLFLPADGVTALDRLPSGRFRLGFRDRSDGRRSTSEVFVLGEGSGAPPSDVTMRLSRN